VIETAIDPGVRVSPLCGEKVGRDFAGFVGPCSQTNINSDTNNFLKMELTFIVLENSTSNRFTADCTD